MTDKEWAEAEERYQRQQIENAAEEARFDEWVIDQMYRALDAPEPEA